MEILSSPLFRTTDYERENLIFAASYAARLGITERGHSTTLHTFRVCLQWWDPRDQKEELRSNPFLAASRGDGWHRGTPGDGGAGSLVGLGSSFEGGLVRYDEAGGDGRFSFRGSVGGGGGGNGGFAGDKTARSAVETMLRSSLRPYDDLVRVRWWPMVMPAICVTSPILIVFVHSVAFFLWRADRQRPPIGIPTWRGWIRSV